MILFALSNQKYAFADKTPRTQIAGKIMPKLTVFVSALLILLGIGTWITSAQNSLTALIPSFFGVTLCFTGLAAFNDNWRKHAMHAAAMISLVRQLGNV